MSIAYLPEIYPDELIYSWACRFYSHNGYLKNKDALKDLLRLDNGKLTFEFFGLFCTEVRSILERQYGDCKQFVLDHTLFSYYARFYDSQMRVGWLNRMSKGIIASVVPNLIELDKIHRYLQYCPDCAKEDRFTYGEAYYHRLHQIPGIVCCIRHCCMLKQTSVKIHNKKDVDLVPAELAIPMDSNAVPAEGLALEYSRYLVAVFMHSLDNFEYRPVGKLLRDSIDAKFFNPVERSLNLMAIAQAMLTMYKPIGLINLPYYVLGYVIKGYSHDPRIILMLAFYLNIPAAELCKPPPSGDNCELYQETERDVYM